MGPLGPRRARSGLDERGHPDAEVAPARPGLGLPAPERGEVHQLGHPLQ